MAAGDIRKVSLWLGHQSLQTTEMYLRTDPAEKLGTIVEWRSPGLGKRRFTEVKDELMAMLSISSQCLPVSARERQMAGGDASGNLAYHVLVVGVAEQVDGKLAELAQPLRPGPWH